MKNLQTGKLTLDPRDLAILKCLQSDPRLGISERSRQVELSAPTVRERLQRLVETGVIRYAQTYCSVSLEAWPRR
jgi:Lrp/AsnC family leucine-responsive transcriptional regulator